MLNLLPGGPLGQIAAWPDALADPGLHDLAVGAVALTICVFWPRRLRRFFPSPLAALAAGTGAALFVLTEDEYRVLLRVSRQVDWRFHVALVLAHETGHRIEPSGSSGGRTSTSKTEWCDGAQGTRRRATNTGRR